MDSNDSFSSNLNMVIEPGQDMSSYGPGGGDGDLPGGGNNLQQPPDGGILSSQQPPPQGGNLPPMNPGDPNHGGSHPRFPTTQNQMFMSSRKYTNK